MELDMTDEERLTLSCQKMLSMSTVSLDKCFILMKYVSVFESNGAVQCPSNVSIPRVEHNPKFYSSACGSVEILLLKFVLPPLMILCLCGNILNLLIYSLSYFDGSSSVHFLRAKAFFNMVFVSSRFLEVIHAWINPASPWLEPLFWHTRSYIMTISNISGTMSTWLTLMVTMETVMCVLFPFIFRQYCTKRLTWVFLVISLTLSTLIHLTLIFTTQTSSYPFIRHHNTTTDNCWYVQHIYALSTPESYYHRMAQKIYLWTQNAVVIVIPTVAMLVCSIMIVNQFTFKILGEAFSQRRKCVIRMTVATTVSHLMLEGPATLTHAAVALRESQEHHYLMCILNHSNNLLSIVNATIPFFVFLLCNEQFRHMTAMYIKAYMQTDGARRKAYLSQAGMRCSRVSRVETERSYIDTKLTSKNSV